MAVVFKKTSKQDEELSQRQKDAMAAVGLLPEDPHPKKANEASLGITIGSTVEINHELFPWIKAYGKGDVGVVEKVYPCRDRAVIDPENYDLFTVNLVSPRVKGRESVDLHRWELNVVTIN